MPLHVKWRFLSVLFALVANQAFAYHPIGRWAQYAALTRKGLFVYGGKTDQYNSYSYTSAPNSNDLLFLPLNNSFDSASPPWELLIGSSNATEQLWPAVAWHTFSTINDSCFMLFGGQPDPNSATVLSGLPDSTSFLHLTDAGQPYWVLEPQSWANQPTRRIRHSSTAVNLSLTFIVGGEKADGSGNAYSDSYVFDFNRSNFASLPNNTGPASIFGHSSVVLSDGRLLVFGGYSQPRSLLIPLSEIWLLDTRGIPSNWSLIEVSNASLPTPRRDFAATLLYNDKVLIHGGADAVLQQNYADGWVLDTSVHPMTWSEVRTLSRLGSRRNHFAVSSGNQILFGFGYGNSGPATPDLYIYDAVKDAFVTSYSPSPSLSATSSTPNLTPTRHTPDAHGSSSRTGSGSSISTGANGFPSGSTGRSKLARNTALAITFSVLGAILVVIILYYLRRRHRQHGRGRHFVSLADDDTDSGRSHTIPTVVMIDEEPHAERGSRFSIFHALRLAGTRMNASGSGPEKPSARRRDMLADEDVYDREWYHSRRTRDAEYSSWSFRSFMSGYLRGQEPSGTSESIRFHKNEVSDPFLDDGVVAELSESEPLSQLHHRHRQGRYADPFADALKQEEGGALSDTLPTSARLLPSVPSASQYNSPPRLNAIIGSLPGRVSPPTLQSSDPYDTPVERLGSTSRSVRGPHSPEIASPTAYATSLINANRGPLQPISRTDSWWKRFTRNSFLDRQLSSTSRKSPSMDFKEHNIPLMSIEEQTGSLALKTVVRKSVEVIDRPESQSVPDFYEGGHNGRSLSSFATADTEVVERIGRIIDVVQRVRTSSHQSSSSSADHASFEGRPPESKPDDSDDLSASEEPTASSTRVELSDIDPFNTSDPLSSLSENVEMESATSTYTSGSGLVASRVRDYERRLSQDNEGPRKTKRDGDVTKVKYGLAPRQSLFIANPDKS